MGAKLIEWLAYYEYIVSIHAPVMGAAPSLSR